MPIINDKEFGEITIRRSAKSRSMKASISPNGGLRISIPTYVPLIMAKRMVVQSRSELRKLLDTVPKLEIQDGMQIGKSHSVHIRDSDTFYIQQSGQQIVVSLGDKTIDQAYDEIKEAILKALRVEAKRYLPRRLAYIAREHGYHYEKIRYSHASSRWGSCSSNGTISLNIALMMLDFELIDYVIMHELAHTKQMNHSIEFWQHVESMCPDYRRLRRILKSHTPTI